MDIGEVYNRMVETNRMVEKMRTRTFPAPQVRNRVPFSASAPPLSTSTPQTRRTPALQFSSRDNNVYENDSPVFFSRANVNAPDRRTGDLRVRVKKWFSDVDISSATSN